MSRAIFNLYGTLVAFVDDRDVPNSNVRSGSTPPAMTTRRGPVGGLPPADRQPITCGPFDAGRVARAPVGRSEPLERSAGRTISGAP